MVAMPNGPGAAQRWPFHQSTLHYATIVLIEDRATSCASTPTLCPKRCTLTADNAHDTSTSAPC
jgi:hypothetical protein